MLYRKVRPDEFRSIIQEGERFLNLIHTKQWTEGINLPSVMETIRAGIYGTTPGLHAWIVSEAYFLLTHHATPWYSHRLILSEMLVYRLYPGAGRMADIPLALETIARDTGCAGVTAGTALAKSDRALSRIYQRAGFRVEAHELYKGLSWVE